MKIHVFENRAAVKAFVDGIQKTPDGKWKPNTPQVSNSDLTVKGWPRVAIERWFMGTCELHYIENAEALAALSKLQPAPAASLLYFDIDMKNKLNNVHASVRVLATNSDEAIKIAKQKLETDLLEFVNNFGRHPNNRLSLKLPSNFWDNTSIAFSVSDQPQVVRFNYDRLHSNYGFSLPQNQ